MCDPHLTPRMLGKREWSLQVCPGRVKITSVATGSMNWFVIAIISLLGDISLVVSVTAVSQSDGYWLERAYPSLSLK